MAIRDHWTLSELRDRWSNPLAGLAWRRAGETRGLLAWALVATAIPAGVGLACAYSPLAALFQDPFPAFGEPQSTLGELYLLGTLLAAFLVVTVGGIVPRAALAVTRDREQRALGPLLITRLSRPMIAVGKLAQAAILPALSTLALLPLLLLGLALGGVEAGSVLAAFALLLLCHLLFVAAAGAVSAWCRRSVVALVWGYLVVAFFCGGSLFAEMLTFGSAAGPPPWAQALAALNPLCLLTDIVSPETGGFFGQAPPGALPVAVGVYALLTLICIAVAARGLRSE